MNWFKKLFTNEATLQQPEWWKQSLFTKQTGSGQSVTVESSMKVSAVHGCVQIISESVAALPLRIYQKTSEGKQVADHPLNSLFKVPNGIQTGFEMREFLLSSLLLRGNAYTQKLRSNSGRLGELIPLYPQHMNVDKGNDGKLIFDYQETGSARVFRQEEIWRIAGRSSNGVTGDSPITQAREAIGLALALEEHGATLFKNGTQVDSVFEIPGELSEEGFTRLKEQILQHQGSSNNHKPMILEGGLVRKDIGMTSEDSQFIETRKLQVADIARFYRVPLHMLNELSNATFSNIEHQSIEFVRDTLTPWLVRIESSIFRDLLTPRERESYFAKHSVNALLRGDIKARNEAYRISVEGGWMNRNEVRELEDLNKADGLDEFILPLNIATNSERETKMQDAVISDLVGCEIKALKHDKGKDPMHFVEFYNRHLTRAANLLAVDKKSLVTYGQARLESIEKGIDDNLLLHITANAAEEMRAITCQNY